VRPADFSENEARRVQCEFGIFVRYLSQIVPLTLILLPARMKQIHGLKSGADETLIPFTEVVFGCRYASAEVIFERFFVTCQVIEPPSANNRAKVTALVHNGRWRIAICDVHDSRVRIGYSFVAMFWNRS
jgi:hypothetical protein